MLELTTKVRVLLILVIFLISGIVFLFNQGGESSAPVPNRVALLAGYSGRFETINKARSLVFPEDHGVHNRVRSETWRFAGTLVAKDSKRYGFQMTFVRLNLGNDIPVRESAWAANQIYRAHFAVTSEDAENIYSYERSSRAALGLAGYSETAGKLWLYGWKIEIRKNRPGETEFFLTASGGGNSMKVTLVPAKPVINYTGTAKIRLYAITRMRAEGVLQLEGKQIHVGGDAWYDHAWGDLPLSQGQLRWNRFMLLLSNNWEFVLMESRRRDGSGTPVTSGFLIAPDASIKQLDPRDLEIGVDGRWRSSASGVTYPRGWRIGALSNGIELTVAPLIEEQEINHSVRSWSGSVVVSGRSSQGRLSGFGHVTLEGYDPDKS